MARGEFLRSTRTPYGYSRQGTPNAGPQTNMLAWVLVIMLLSAMALVSWLFPAYVFRNPEIPFNYKLLRKLGKLDDLKAFSSARRPPSSGTFHNAVTLFDSESGRSEDYLAGFNSLQKRLYLQNYSQGKMFGYISGSFTITQVRKLGDDDFFPGIAIQATSVELPNLVLEYLLPLAKVPEEIPYQPGSKLTLGRADYMAVILHMQRLSGDRLSISAVPLTYPQIKFPKADTLDVVPPSNLNMRATWPVFPDAAASS